MLSTPAKPLLHTHCLSTTFPRSRALFIATLATNYRSQQSKQKEINALHLPLSGSIPLAWHYFCGNSSTSAKTSQTTPAPPLPPQPQWWFHWGPQRVLPDWDLAQHEATSEAAAASTRVGISPWAELARGPPSSPQVTEYNSSYPGRACFPTGQGPYPR